MPASIQEIAIGTWVWFGVQIRTAVGSGDDERREESEEW